MEATVPDRPDLFLTAYVALVLFGGLLSIATIKMIRDSRFLDLREPLWLNLCRCSALVVIGFGMMGSASWHVRTGRDPWISEMFILVGLDLYLGTAVISTHVRSLCSKPRLPVKA